MPRIVPQEGPQTAFLTSEANIAIFGGAAGSGKSWSLLLEAMRWPSKRAGFDSVMFRRNTTDIRRPGGLWSESMKLYPRAKVPGLPVPHILSWRWRDAGSVKLAHLEYDHTVLDWHGSQIGCLAFDELTTFSKHQFFYMLSRNRSTSGIRPYVRASCNADAGSWVADLIAWWIDQDTGYPIPERSGVLRYFVRGANDSLEWFDSKRAAMAATGQPRETIKSLTFIAAKLADNPALMRNDPGYLGNLMMLPAVERERLLNGNWKIRPTAGSYFPRTAIATIAVLPTDVKHWVRRWDLAATPATDRNPSPSATASVLMGRRENGRFIIAHGINVRRAAHDVRAIIKNIAAQDKENHTGLTVVVPQDPGQAGKDQAASMITFLAGYRVKAVRETGSKQTRAEPLAAQWQAGNVDILAGPWNEAYLAEMDGFPEAPHDDYVDVSSGAFLECVSGASNYDRWKALAS
jgi:predicted phage terminase large subunit-like protein